MSLFGNCNAETIKSYKYLKFKNDVWMCIIKKKNLVTFNLLNPKQHQLQMNSLKYITPFLF